MDRDISVVRTQATPQGVPPVLALVRQDKEVREGGEWLSLDEIRFENWPNVIKFTASLADREDAAEGGHARYDDNILNGRKDSWGIDSPWSHVLGAMGELVVARLLGIQWEPLRPAGRFRATPDVGPYEVRTARLPWGQLRIKRGDPLNRPFVLVVPSIPLDGKLCENWYVVGQITAAHAQRDEWRKEDWDCWLVPQSALHPINDMA